MLLKCSPSHFIIEPLSLSILTGVGKNNSMNNRQYLEETHQRNTEFERKDGIIIFEGIS